MTSSILSLHGGGMDQTRTSITVLVLGDEGVGKSSLISTFVSRHFSEVVPGIMTRVRLPPDPESSCITTIVDSQGGDVALLTQARSLNMSGAGNSSASLATLQQSLSTGTGTNPSAVGGMENVDSIILVYDLDRQETFFRLENHWLPLIERCYNGELPVIVAGNKMDLYRPSSAAGATDEQALARSRQQIVSLMQRFRFIRQCIKCSAKNLLRVDEAFLKAQQSVLYPFTPLYDLDIGELSTECKQAFTRIFRIYDRDNDGLLSHSELDRFQHETFQVPVYERDLSGWKKVISRNNPTNEEVVRDGKFTVAGFLAIFDVFISQNRLDVPWQALRKFGYRDNLQLSIPESVSHPPEGADNWNISPKAQRFLADLFYQFDSDGDGKLSEEDIKAIFSILPYPSLPPWHPSRSTELFDNAFAKPKIFFDQSGSSTSEESSTPQEVLSMSQSLSTSGITIVSSESFPTVNLSMERNGVHPISKNLTFMEWVGLWHMIAAISPVVARTELFRLGHVEDRKEKKSKRRRKKSVVALSKADIACQAESHEIRVLVMGSPQCGKSALLNTFCGVEEPLKTRKTRYPEISSAHVRIPRNHVVKQTKGDDEDEVLAYITFTEVPEAEAENQARRQWELKSILSGGGCDLVMLVFDTTNSASLAYAKHLESSLLSEDMPRLYVGTKIDQVSRFDEESGAVIDEAAAQCTALDLEPPLLTSASTESPTIKSHTLQHIVRCFLETPGVEHLRSKPHEEEKRKEAARRRNRKFVWLGVGVGVAVAVVGYLLTTASSGKPSGRRDRLDWLKSWFPSTSPKSESSSSES